MPEETRCIFHEVNGVIFLFIYGQGFTVIQLFFCFSNLSQSRMPGEDNFDSERFVTIEYVHPGAIHHQLKKKVALLRSFMTQLVYLGRESEGFYHSD